MQRANLPSVGSPLVFLALGSFKGDPSIPPGIPEIVPPGIPEIVPPSIPTGIPESWPSLYIAGSGASYLQNSSRSADPSTNTFLSSK